MFKNIIKSSLLMAQGRGLKLRLWYQGKKRINIGRHLFAIIVVTQVERLSLPKRVFYCLSLFAVIVLDAKTKFLIYGSWWHFPGSIFRNGLRSGFPTSDSSSFGEISTHQSSRVKFGCSPGHEWLSERDRLKCLSPSHS